MTKHPRRESVRLAPRRLLNTRVALCLVMLLVVGPAAVPSEPEPGVPQTDIATEWAQLQGCLDDLIVAMQSYQTTYAEVSPTAEEYDRKLHDLLGRLTPVVGQLGIVVGTLLLKEGHPIERGREDPCRAEGKPPAHPLSSTGLGS